MSILSLTRDLLRCIDKYLSPLDITRWSQTCTQFRTIFSSEKFWYRHLVQHYPEETTCPMSRSYKKWYYDLYYMPLPVREILQGGEDKYQQLLKVIATLNSCSRQEQFIYEDDEMIQVSTNNCYVVFTSRVWPIPIARCQQNDAILTPSKGSAYAEVIYHIDSEKNVGYYRAIVSIQNEYYVTLSQLSAWLQSIKITHRPLPSPIIDYRLIKEHRRYFDMLR